MTAAVSVSLLMLTLLSHCLRLSRPTAADVRTCRPAVRLSARGVAEARWFQELSDLFPSHCNENGGEEEEEEDGGGADAAAAAAAPAGLSGCSAGGAAGS